MVQSIAVCGAGTMGSGIALVAAQAGFSTIQFDLNAAALEKSKQGITAQLTKLVQKDKIKPAEMDSILARIHFTNQMNDCKANLIIEAIIEDLPIKQNLFKQLYSINAKDTIYASNTSSISIDAIANELDFAENIVGMHFFNPAPIMKLVEIIKGKQTLPAVVAQIIDLTKQLGKVPVVCKDAPGFIVNRVARHFYLESMEMVSKGLITIEQADGLMEAAGFKMGPFKLMDLIGLDINYSVSNIVWESLGKPTRLQPSHLQKEKVANGDLGKKTGKGFYTY